MEKEKQFYMVWSPQGSAPTAKHFDGKTAQAEAERLANLNPSRRFYVLKAVRYAERISPVAVVQLDPPAVSPF